MVPPLVFAALVACSSSITQEEADDLAYAAVPLLETESGVGTAEAYADAAAISVAAAEFESEGDGSYSGSFAQLRYGWMVDCFDGAGRGVVCGETTARAEVEATVDGALDTSIYDATLAFASDWVVDGLNTTEVTLEGGAQTELTTAFDALFRDVQRTWDLDMEGNYDLTGDTTAATVSGTVFWDVFAVRTRTARGTTSDSKLDTTIEATFDGQGTVQLLIDGSYTYSVDATTGAVTTL